MKAKQKFNKTAVKPASIPTKFAKEAVNGMDPVAISLAKFTTRTPVVSMPAPASNNVGGIKSKKDPNIAC